MANSDIDRLRELTNSLPPVSDLKVIVDGCPPVDDNVVVYGSGPEDICVGIGLLNISEIAVQRAIIPRGSRFPRHNHQQHEHLIVYRGKLLVHVEQGEQVTEAYIGPGESAHLLPNEAHWVEAIETAHILGVTVPASDGYPGA